jgi:hypothetical protein
LGSLRGERIVQVEKHCVTIFDLEKLYGMAQHEPVKNSVADNVERPSDENILARRAAAAE